MGTTAILEPEADRTTLDRAVSLILDTFEGTVVVTPRSPGADGS